MSRLDFPIVEQRRFPLGPVIFLLCCVAAIIVLFMFEPGLYPFYPRCLFHQTTGLLCPGCGSLRAVHQLLHGHVLDAFRLNALLMLAIPAATWILFRKLLWPERRLLDFRPTWLWSALALGLLFGIARNLPLARTFWLAP
jgi:hypothetical protein